jgi:hypothetical protein
MSDNEPENGEDQIDEAGRNPTQQKIDEELAEHGDAPIGVEIPSMREDRQMSEVIPEDPDRGGGGAIEGGKDDEDETDESV